MLLPFTYKSSYWPTQSAKPENNLKKILNIDFVYIDPHHYCPSQNVTTTQTKS